jgi:hypothetical protein
VAFLGSRARSCRACILGLACATGLVTSHPLTAAEDRMIVVRPEDAKFVPVDPSQPNGTQVAVLWGDPAQGPSSMLMKMKKTDGRLHYHTSTYDLVLLEGQMKHWGEREKETEVKALGPGSYWHQPGREVHADSCLTDECLMFIKWEGKRDGMLAEPRTAR